MGFISPPQAGADLFDEVKRLQKALAREERAHAHTIKQRDEAEEAADKLASMVLGEPIDWPDHQSKWAEALSEAHGERFNAQWYPLKEVCAPQGKCVLFAWVRSKGTEHTMRTGRFNGRICIPKLGEEWKTQPTHWRELPVLDVIDPKG